MNHRVDYMLEVVIIIFFLVDFFRAQKFFVRVRLYISHNKYIPLTRINESLKEESRLVLKLRF